MNRRFIWAGIVAGILIVSGGLSENLVAQSEGRPSAPSGPLLRPAPAFSEWEVTHAYPQDSLEATSPGRKDSIYLRQPRKSVVTKTQNIAREAFVRVNGEKIERWQIDRTVYVYAPQVGFWAMYNAEFKRNNPNADAEKLPLPDSGFVGLDWISADTYAGTLELNGRSLLVFLPGYLVKPDISDPEVIGKLPTMAYVDAATRLPVTVKQDGARRDFVFRAPPGQVLTLPPHLAADLKKAADIESKANRAPGREF